MSWEDREDTTIYKVVVNHEEQYSIWPADRENALGWNDAGKTGTKSECLAYIEEVWTDMRPLSLRKKMEEMEWNANAKANDLLETETIGQRSNRRLMKKYLVYFLAATATVLVGVIVYVLAPYPDMRPDGLRPGPSVQLAAGARRCAPSTLYYSERNGYADAGEGVVDSYCSKWQFELQRAIQASDLESARKALAMGANPNSPGDDYSLTYALPLAASIGNIEMVRLLLDNGADIDFQECCCMSCYAPLTHAVDAENVELVRLLVARGANVNYAIAYEDGMTLRKRAGRKGNKNVLEILDEAGASPWRLRTKKRLTKLVHFVV